MEKDFYLYSEIILSLRAEYKKTQELLNELAKYVKIEDKRLDKFSLTTNVGINKTNIIRLDIYLKQNALRNMLNYLSFINQSYSLTERWNLDPEQYAPNDEYFIVGKVEDKNDYSFKKDDYSFTNPHTPHYSVIITNHKEFNQLVDDIYNMSIMRWQEMCAAINKFHTLYINASGIKMTTSFENIGLSFSPLLNYESATDNIISNPDCKDGIQITYDMFNTKIPKSIIPPYIRTIIDSNLKQIENLNIQIQKPFKRLSELTINQNNGTIILQKK